MLYLIMDKSTNEQIGQLDFDGDIINIGDGVEVDIKGDFREYRVTRKVYTNDIENDGFYDFEHVRLYCWDTFTNRKGKIEESSD